MKYRFLTLFLLFLPIKSALSADFHVRPDGGTLQQCSGLINAAWSVGVSNKACAVSHIFELLKPETQTVHISGGDRVFIHNNSNGTKSAYEMGRHGAYTSGDCSASYNYDCVMPAIPSGTAQNPTIITGGSIAPNGRVSCGSVSPELWGSGRAKRVFSLQNSSHVNLSCLTITDHHTCIGASGYPDTTLICDRSAPYNKSFADTGVYMVDAEYINLTGLRIEGLSTGIHAGRVGYINLVDTHLHANHSAGWNGDIGASSSANTGPVNFTDSSITFNGCGLTYAPGTSDHGKPTACAKQSLGGYGDGLGTASTGGDWLFQNTSVMYNNSDGIDLLYHENGGKVTIKNSRIEGNGGNQLKVSGNAELVNNVIIGNCGWNSRQEASLGGNGENCRALGTAVSISYTSANDKAVLLNNTIFSEGDCLLSSGPRGEINAAQQQLYVVNNIFYAGKDYLQSSQENSCMHYSEQPFPQRQVHNNIIHMVKGYANPCVNFNENIPMLPTVNTGLCTVSPNAFFDDSIRSNVSNPHFEYLSLGIVNSAYDIHALNAGANKVMLESTSPAIGLGFIGSVGGVSVPTKDFAGKLRGTPIDIGAFEYSSVVVPPTVDNSGGFMVIPIKHKNAVIVIP